MVVLKRRLVGLLLVVCMCFGFAPSALAHNGSHDFWEACRLGGSSIVFIVTALVTKRVSAPANLPPAATTAVQVGSTAVGVGNAGGFYVKYGSHAVEAISQSQGAAQKAISNPASPNFLAGSWH